MSMYLRIDPRWAAAAVELAHQYDNSGSEISSASAKSFWKMSGRALRISRRRVGALLSGTFLIPFLFDFCFFGKFIKRVVSKDSFFELSTPYSARLCNYFSEGMLTWV